MDWANAQTTTSLSVSLSNLTANTAYRFYVRSVCSATEYSNEVMTRFRTACPATQSVPYSIDFEDQVIGGSNINSYPTFVDCWDRICDATSYASQGWPYVYSTTTSARSGDRTLYFSQQAATSTTLDKNIAVLPLFSQAANTLQLSFWAKKSNSTTAGFIITGVMTDPTDATTFTAVDTFEVAAANGQYTQYVSFLNKYTGTGNYIAICCTKNRTGITSAINFYVDDIEVDALPSCFIPKTPTLRSVTASTAVVEWIPNGPETQWQIQYKNINSDVWTDYPAILTTDSCVLSGLAGNTRLDVRVRAYCDSADQSEWSNVLSFVTECDDYITIPYSANFDYEPTGGTNGTTYPDFAHCWYRLTDKPTATSYSGYPYVAAVAAYQRTGSGKVVYFAQYPSGFNAQYPTYQMAILPAIDTVMTPISSLQLSFWAKKSLTTMPGRLVIGAISDPTDFTTFTGIDTIDILTLADNTYHYYTSVLHSYTGNAAHVAIMVPRNIAGVTTNSTTSYWYIDDVVLDYGPTCFAPTDVTVDTVDARFATVSWTPEGLESAWNLRYKLAADTTWTVVPGTVTYPYTISNLIPNKIYEVSVRSACDSTDFSLWTMSTQFHTLCAPVTAEQLGTISFEATEGFVTGTGNLANCWTVGNLKTTQTTYIPYAYSSATYAHTGSVSLQMNVYTSATANYDSAYAILPEIDFTNVPLSEYDLNFYIKRGGSTSAANNYTDTLWVGVMSDRTDFATFQKLGYVLAGNTAYVPASFSFAESQLTSGHITLLAAVDTSATTTYSRSKFYIDDISLVARRYAISADVNDTTMGAVEVYADSMAYGQVDTLVAYPAVNHHFVRWSNGSTDQMLIYTVTGDTTFTAYFAIDSFEVSQVVVGAEYGTVANDGGVTSTPALYPYGTEINFTATPNAHADFIGWSNGSTTLTTSYTVTGDTIIGAVFANHAYAIAALSADTAMGSAVASDATAYVGDTVTFTATAAANYHFVNWSNGATSAVTTVVVASDTTLTAYFALDTFAVSLVVVGPEYGVVANDGGVTATPTYYTYGTTINFTATPNAHADFIGWSDNTTALTSSYVVTGDTIITATFANHAYNVAVNVSDSTMGVATASAATAFYGDTILFTAVANTGYQFLGWDNGSTDAALYVVIESDTTLTANFTYILYNVSATSADTSMGVVVDITELPEYHYGDVATFRAVANAGYEFVSWNTGETTEEISVTVTSDITLVATFRAIQTGVENVAEVNYIVYTDQMDIVLHGAENQTAACYDAAGRLVSMVKAATEDQRFSVAIPGVYVIRVNNTAISVVVK